MPNNWYHDAKGRSVSYEKEKDDGIYTVVRSTFVESYHYHGSSFEYTWDLVLRAKNGEELQKRVDTTSRYENLNGKTVELGRFGFDVVKGV